MIVLFHDKLFLGETVSRETLSLPKAFKNAKEEMDTQTRRRNHPRTSSIQGKEEMADSITPICNQ